VLDLAAHYSKSRISTSHPQLTRPTSPPLTRQHKKQQPINHQHRPEHRHIKHTKPTRRERNRHRLRRAIPEFEFRKTSDEGTEFLVVFCRENAGGVGGGGGTAFFHVGVGVGGVEGGIEFWGEEGEEEVEEVDSEGVGDCGGREVSGLYREQEGSNEVRLCMHER
jgi:hypothetical protein